MASGLNSLKASVSRNILRCLKHSCDVSTPHKARWRSIASLSLPSGLVTGTYEQNEKESLAGPLSLHDLKRKEKGDWRNLSLQEKQALYRMSFNQPLQYALDQPADEWKLILGGTFTAMAFMMMAVYFWESKPVFVENDIGPLSSKSKEEIRISPGESMESVA